MLFLPWLAVMSQNLCRMHLLVWLCLDVICLCVCHLQSFLQTIPAVSWFLPASEPCASHVWTREPQFEPFFCARFDVVFALHTSFFCASDGDVFLGFVVGINASKFTQFVQCHCSIYLAERLRLPAQWARCENPLGLEQLIDFLYLLLHFSHSPTV